MAGRSLEQVIKQYLLISLCKEIGSAYVSKYYLNCKN